MAETTTFQSVHTRLFEDRAVVTSVYPSAFSLYVNPTAVVILDEKGAEIARGANYTEAWRNAAVMAQHMQSVRALIEPESRRSESPRWRLGRLIAFLAVFASIAWLVVVGVLVYATNLAARNPWGFALMLGFFVLACIAMLTDSTHSKDKGHS